MTEFLFRDDAYLSEAVARVTGAGEGGVELDRTIFYAASGGQPGDAGWLTGPDGAELAVTEAVHPGGDRSRVLHPLAPGAVPPAPGTEVRLRLDWERRLRLMRTHTALHLLSVAMPFPVTGGQIGEGRGRLDFDMPEPPADLEAIAARLNAFVAADLPVTAEWITEDALTAQPELVKTMKVKPPSGQGRVRLVRIGAGRGPWTSSPAAAPMSAPPPRSARSPWARSRRRAARIAGCTCNWRSKRLHAYKRGNVLRARDVCREHQRLTQPRRASSMVGAGPRRRKDTPLCGVVRTRSTL